MKNSLNATEKGFFFLIIRTETNDMLKTLAHTKNEKLAKCY